MSFSIPQHGGPWYILTTPIVGDKYFYQYFIIIRNVGKKYPYSQNALYTYMIISLSQVCRSLISRSVGYQHFKAFQIHISPVCVCVCTHTHTHKHMQIHMCTYICTYIHTDTDTYLYITCTQHIYKYTNTHIVLLAQSPALNDSASFPKCSLYFKKSIASLNSP